MAGKLLGSYRVVRTVAAIHGVSKLFPKVSDRMEVRRHALKLAFWPDGAPALSGGQILDLDWGWVEGMPNGIRDVGELRIDDEIGGHRNLRIIFFVGDRTVCRPLPLIWVLTVFPKKRQDFSSGYLTQFKLRRKWVLDQFYRGR